MSPTTPPGNTAQAGSQLIASHVPPEAITAAAGRYDVVGDIHGCMDELEDLITLAGYQIEPYQGSASTPIRASHPEGRRLIFLGDLVDRGPRSEDVLRLALGMVESDQAEAVIGNHDDKLARFLAGRNVTVAHGLGLTLEQLRPLDPDFVARIGAFLRDRPFQLRLPATGPLAELGDGYFTATHAAAPEEHIDSTTKEARSAALYGVTNGEIDSSGYPLRIDWAVDYRSRRPVMHGHTVVPQPTIKNRVFCLDTGCVFGRELTLMRADTLEILSVPARRAYAGI